MFNKKQENILKDNGWEKSAYHENKFLRGNSTITQNGNCTNFGTSKNYGISNSRLRDKSS